MAPRLFLANLLIGLVCSGAAFAAECTLDRATGTSIEPEPFLQNAWGLRWNRTTDRLAFMQPGDHGYYRLFTAKGDGSDRLRVDASHPEIPEKHQGPPYWHPSGHFLLFTTEKPEWSGRAMFGNPDYEAMPGFGRHNDLWLVRTDGLQSWRLIDDPNTRDEGILVPVFAPDGRHIAWSSRLPGGKYALKVADFAETPQPHLANFRTFQPGGTAYYETGSFSSDSASLLYTSDQDTKSFWHSQIYRLDLVSGQATRLTPGNDYNEHPTVVSTPTGDWVVYMSTKGVDRYPGHFFLGTDWYARRLDGSGEKRLTTMNLRRKDNPENSGEMQVAGAVAVSPSGSVMLGDVQDNLTRQTGFVRRLHLTCP
jgi:Tol biopolymer transport system component